MSFFPPNTTLGRDPIDAITARPDEAVLAVITGVEGPSYRPVGAIMAIFANGERSGTLSSGCVESDIALQAAKALETGVPGTVRYGLGSPFFDIQLPCGGGLEILLLPRPDRGVLQDLTKRRSARKPFALWIDTVSGHLTLMEDGRTGRFGTGFVLRFDPAIRFLVFGKGPEACTFAALVQSAGYPNCLLSPDPETLEIGAASGCLTRQLHQPGFPADLKVDPQTAVVLFFHDHDWEPKILKEALDTPAFYIGAQGSRRARDARLRELATMGICEQDLARLSGPIGLIPSARDAGTLAVSVLAEVLAIAMASTATT